MYVRLVEWALLNCFPSVGSFQVPMNAAQIQTLSQIQAQAIVNARKSSGSPQQIQTQIQLQAQALVHAHTQAQIAAGIYKGDKKDSLLSKLTPVQLKQQEQLTSRQEEEKAALVQEQAAAASTAEQKKEEMDSIEATHKAQVAELHETFRKQNAAAQYAGVKVATVPNPSAAAGAPMPVAALPSTAITTMPTIPSMPSSLDHGEMTPSATSPQFIAKLNGTLKSFWANQLQQVQQMPPQSEQDFKNHNDLPLARIKRIMKSDEDVRMISAEAPVLFAKACELFILELTVRSWTYSQHHKRRTLQKEDIKEAIQKTDIFDFLVDVIQ